MKRPIMFALEVAAGLVIVSMGGWVSEKIAHKLNAKANADVRASFAQERMAEALERAFPKKEAVHERAIDR